jgi:EpsI family protein
VRENKKLHLGLESGAVRERVFQTMTPVRAKSQSRMRWAAALGAVAAFALFQFYGNATRGYVDTPSLFWWWISQWIDPHAETEHGWLILGLSGWLFWRGMRGERRAESLERTERTAESSERPDRDSVGEGAGAESVQPKARSLQRSRVRQQIEVGDSGSLLMPLMGIVGALALHTVGFVAQQSRISIVALLLFCGSLVALADRRWGRAAMFPLGFLMFAIPLNILDSVGFWLRLGVIQATAGLAHFWGIHLLQSGTQLLAPDGRFQYDVAAACSGVRSLMALAALSLLVGYLNFSTAWRRGLMFLLCFPLTYLGNVIRVVLIILAAQRGGPKWGAVVHDVMGYGVFVIVVGGVMAAAALIRRWWPEKESAQRRRAAPAASAKKRGHWAIISVLIIVLVGVEIAFLAHITGARQRGLAGVRLDATGHNPVELPAFLGTEWIGRRAEVSAVERAILPADTGFSRRSYVLLEHPAHAVFVSIVLSGRDRTSIHRPELCLVGQGWTIADGGSHAFQQPADPTAPVVASLLRAQRIDPVSKRNLSALMAYWFVSADAVVATHWQRFWHDAWNRIRHGRADRWAYVLVQADSDDGETAALARMQTVLSATLPVFQGIQAGDEPR